MRKIWYISGINGEYEDQHTWEVVAFTTKELAEDYLKNLSEWWEGTKIEYDGDVPYEIECPLDPTPYVYMGAIPLYRVFELELIGDEP